MADIRVELLDHMGSDLDHHAQYESQVVASGIWDAMSGLFPVSLRALCPNI